MKARVQEFQINQKVTVRNCTPESKQKIGKVTARRKFALSCKNRFKNMGKTCRSNDYHQIPCTFDRWEYFCRAK